MSLSDYQEKIADRFRTFDQDGDGAVTVADFEGLAQSILREYGLAPTTPKGKALISAARKLGQDLVEMADSDGDGEVNQEEFVNAAATRLRNKPEGLTKLVRPWATAVIAVADDDGDGQVTVNEWARMLRAMRATPERAQTKAEAIDTDGDGTVSVDEVLATAVAFYTTDEPAHEFAAAR
ncbi:EF-hand domain-containing protein [Streptomyces sp. NPDC046557]|uniref:EF-hand domain-containing protein n=1 Tax=Streptomyces sp. NPDC046557 TaxID=3155372 RepID=UPI0033D5C9D3